MDEAAISVKTLRETMTFHVSEKLTFRLVESGQLYAADIEELTAMIELLGRTLTIAGRAMSLMGEGYDIYDAGHLASYEEYQARLDAGLNP